MFYFVAYYYEDHGRVGFGNSLKQFDFHPLTDPKLAGFKIAQDTGFETVIVINVQEHPGNEC